MTFKVMVHLGTYDAAGPAWGPTSEIKLWVAREGQTSELVLDWTGTTDTNGYLNTTVLSAPVSTVERIGKIHLLPYQSYKDDWQSHATGHTWYDELIISTANIADPGVTPPTPPTSGTTVQGATVKGATIR
jgi:hypothetical protein